MNTRHDDDYNFVFKIILLGDTSVGKTHLLSRYIKGQLPRSKFPTIGVEFATKPVPLKTGGTVRVQIWDTGKSKMFILIIFSTINHFEYLSIAIQKPSEILTQIHYFLPMMNTYTVYLLQLVKKDSKR